MTSKLTAKLSDGTEWTVADGVTRDGVRHVCLTPLKPSPPKEVYMQEYGDGSLSMLIYSSADTEEYKGSKFHRYVLAEELKRVEGACVGCGCRVIYFKGAAFSKRNLCTDCHNADKKQPREWWDIIKTSNGDIVKRFYSEKYAISFVATENEFWNNGLYEVVHVREVLANE